MSEPWTTDPEYLWTACNDILEVARRSLIEAPERYYVARGRPVSDQEQLTVHIERVYVTYPSVNQQRNPLASKHFVPAAEIVLNLLRYVTDLAGTETNAVIPDAPTIDAEAKALSIDGLSMWQALTAAVSGDTLLPGIHQGTFLFKDMVPVTAQSGLAGWKITMEVVLA